MTTELSAAEASTPNPFIACQGLVKIYKVADLETVALQGLDLEVQAGEVLAIVGNSGSGKSTLLNILGGLDRPSAGRIHVAGLDLLSLSDRELARYRRETVGFVWQQSARNLIPYLSALENVQVPMMIAGQAASARRRWAIDLLASVGLADRGRHRPSELSGGEQQRVAIAVAMANRPKIILADEPTGEVDTQTAQGIYQAFRRVNQEHGPIVIVVSHDRTIASQVHRVVAIRDGRVSTETTRKQDKASGGETPQELEELVVLDAAGRLQIPRELVERFGLKGRVRVEEVDGHVAIIPVFKDDAR